MMGTDWRGAGWERMMNEDGRQRMRACVGCRAGTGL